MTTTPPICNSHINFPLREVLGMHKQVPSQAKFEIPMQILEKFEVYYQQE